MTVVYLNSGNSSSGIDIFPGFAETSGRIHTICAYLGIWIKVNIPRTRQRNLDNRLYFFVKLMLLFIRAQTGLRLKIWEFYILCLRPFFSNINEENNFYKCCALSCNFSHKKLLSQFHAEKCKIISLHFCNCIFSF